MSAKLLYRDKSETILVGIENIGNGVIELPDTVVSIEECAFSGRNDVLEVDMTEAKSLTSIGKFAFYGCKNLKTVTLRPGIQKIGRSAFQNCSSLEKIEIFYGISKIEAWTFSGCTALKEILIPDGVREIGTQAFANCYQLENFYTNSTDTSLQSDVFMHVSQCTIHIPFNCITKYEDNIWRSSNIDFVELDTYSYKGILYKKNIDGNTLLVAEKQSVNQEAIIVGEVSIGDTIYPVVGIVDEAFRGNKDLESVHLPANISTIGERAFAECKNLKEFKVDNIADANFRIVESALYTKDMTTLIAFPAVGPVESLNIPETVTNIVAGAFSAVRNLKSIRFNNVFSNQEMLRAAFEDGDKTVKNNCVVFVPESANTMANYMFNIGYVQVIQLLTDNTFTKNGFVYKIIGGNYSDCANKEVELSKMLSTHSVQDLILPQLICGFKLVSIGHGAFRSCAKLRTVELPNTVTKIGYSAFKDCKGLSEVYLPDTITSIGGSAFYGCSALKTITLSKALINLGNGAFCECSALKSLTLFESVKTIGSSTFYGCSSLSSMKIPNSVTMIGGAAFYGCSNLSSISIPNSVISIGNSAFYDSAISSVTIPGNIPQLGNNVFSECTQLTSVTLPNSITRIGNYAFYACAALTSVNFPNKLTCIGIAAFSGCKSLLSANMPNSVREINSSAFYGCSALKSMVISNSVKSIDNFAFYGCTSMEMVSIPTSVTSIGTYAFASCSRLESVTIPNTVTYIGSYAFASCSRMSSLSISNAIQSIGDSVFSKCSALGYVVIPKFVKSIGSEAFANCSALEAIDCTLLEKTPRIADANAFDGLAKCKVIVSDVKKFIEEDNGKEWNAIFGNRIVDDTSRFEENGIDYIVIDEEKKYVELVKCPNAYETIEIKDTVYNPYTRKKYAITKIGSEAFRLNNKITTVSFLGQSLTTIGTSAFKECSYLKSISLPLSLTTIGPSAFRDCVRLKEISFPSSLQTIDRNAFQNCSGLINVNLNSSLKTIGSNAFDGCDKMVIIEFPASVSKIEGCAFQNCTNLEYVGFASSEVIIGGSAFFNCTRLTTIDCTSLKQAPAISTNSFKEDKDAKAYVASKKDFVSTENGKKWNTAFDDGKRICSGGGATMKVINNKVNAQVKVETLRMSE